MVTSSTRHEMTTRSLPSSFQLKGSVSTPVPYNNRRVQQQKPVLDSIIDSGEDIFNPSSYFHQSSHIRSSAEYSYNTHNEESDNMVQYVVHSSVYDQHTVTSNRNSSRNSNRFTHKLSNIRKGVPKVNVLREPRLHQTYNYKAPSHAKLQSHCVGYAEYGPSSGHPVFVIGGYGCTRLVGIMFEELACKHNLRMIWPERPGYGLSEECNAQDITALEWAEVVTQLADCLGIRKFGLIGQSVGTVFALAIAHRFINRVWGPIYLISPWVSTQAANTFKWTRKLPAPIVAKTVSLALDVMWIFSKGTKSIEKTGQERNNAAYNKIKIDPSTNKKSDSEGIRSPVRNTMIAFEEDELLASLDDDLADLPTDFPPNRPLRHFVRPKHMSLYLAMNKKRMSEAYNQGQLCDVLVALEKYNDFGFAYSDVKVSVSAVWGDKDGLIPAKAIDILANSVNDIRLKILESESHDLVWKEGVMEWAIRGIAERRQRRI